MPYVCNICNNGFNRLSSYEKHLNKKTTCNVIKREQNDIDKRTCQYCKKILSSTSRLKTHIETCKTANNNNLNQTIVNLIKQNELLVEKVEKMDKQSEIFNEKLDKIMAKEMKTINITNVNQQQMNIYNIVPFGKEKFDYITKEEYNEIFEQGFRCLQMLIPLIYCNNKNPENMNVYISNFKDDSIRIFDGKNWIIEKKDYVLRNMYNSKRDFLELKFEDMYEKLSKDAKYFFKNLKLEIQKKTQ